MNNLLNNKYLLISILLLFCGCKTFFEQDISSKTVVLLSPSDGITTDIATQNFVWNKVEDASGYRFQIASPSFDSTQIIMTDTLLSENKFGLTLFPSRFQWRVRAENSVYQTSWSYGEFSVFSTSDLSRQSINLTAPGSITNSATNYFKWDKLYNAKNYTLVIFKDYWDGIAMIEPLEGDLDASYQTLPDGKYIWGVKGRNETSETTFAKKEVMIDTTSPKLPVLVAPADSSSVSETTVRFTWNSQDLTSGIARDTLKIYSDKTLKTIIKTLVSDNNTIETNLAGNKIYYWAVKSVDKAGNASILSKAFMITIK